MASFSIKKRTLKSGETRFTVDIIVKNNSAIIHRESKTFRKKELARSYGYKRVQELEDPATFSQKSVPIYVLLDRFMEEPELWNRTGRTKLFVINMRRDGDISRTKRKFQIKRAGPKVSWRPAPFHEANEMIDKLPIGTFIVDEPDMNSISYLNFYASVARFCVSHLGLE